MKRLNRMLGSGQSLNLLREKLRSQEDLLMRIRALLSHPLDEHCIWTVQSGGNLTLFADSPVWASRLRYLSAHLQQQLRRQGLKIGRIQVRITLINKGYPRKSGERRWRRANPISRSNASLLMATAQTVNDPALQAALERLGRHGLE